MAKYCEEIFGDLLLKQPLEPYPVNNLFLIHRFCSDWIHISMCCCVFFARLKLDAPYLLQMTSNVKS